MPKSNEQRFPAFPTQIVRDTFMAEYCLRYGMWPEAAQELKHWMELPPTDLPDDHLRFLVGLTLSQIQPAIAAKSWLSSVTREPDVWLARIAIDSLILDGTSPCLQANLVFDLLDKTKEVEEYSRQRLRRLLSVMRDKRLAVYGCGKFFRSVCGDMGDLLAKMNVLVVDRSAHLHGRQVEGFTVQPPSVLCDFGADCILLATTLFMKTMREEIGRVFEFRHIPPLLEYPMFTLHSRGDLS